MFSTAHCSKLKIVLNENVTHQFKHHPVIKKCQNWLNSVSNQDYDSKKGQKWARMLREFSYVTNFNIYYSDMNRKC